MSSERLKTKLREMLKPDPRDGAYHGQVVRLLTSGMREFQQEAAPIRPIKRIIAGRPRRDFELDPTGAVCRQPDAKRLEPAVGQGIQRMEGSLQQNLRLSLGVDELDREYRTIRGVLGVGIGSLENPKTS
jgi:hypothetical protein